MKYMTYISVQKVNMEESGQMNDLKFKSKSKNVYLHVIISFPFCFCFSRKHVLETLYGYCVF